MDNSTVDITFALSKKICSLRKRKRAIILAHYYQRPEVQDIADFVGDSLELARRAAETQARIIVFAGVRFMAETAKILNPTKKVLIPDLEAGCSLDDGCPPEAFELFLQSYPGHTVVTYINCSARIKAMSDYICTSSNAVQVINSIPREQPLLFAPDQNLGRYLIEQTGRDMVLWPGSCIVHEAFSFDKLLDLIRTHPGALIVAHPESQEHIVQTAHYVGSTTAMLNYIKTRSEQTFIVATEAGILHRMRCELPGKELIPAPSKEDNHCACSECAFMKLNTLENMYRCLDQELPEICVPSIVARKAIAPLNRMLRISGKKR